MPEGCFVPLEEMPPEMRAEVEAGMERERREAAARLREVREMLQRVHDEERKLLDSPVNKDRTAELEEIVRERPWVLTGVGWPE